MRSAVAGPDWRSCIRPLRPSLCAAGRIAPLIQTEAKRPPAHCRTDRRIRCNCIHSATNMSGDCNVNVSSARWTMTDGSSRSARRRHSGRLSCARLLTPSARRVESLSSTLVLSLSLATQLTRSAMRGHGQAADRRLRGGWLLRAAGCGRLLQSPLLPAPISAAMRSRLTHSQICLLDICLLS